MELIKLPFYVKLSCIFLSIICFSFIFYIGRDIVTPILMAFLFSILLLPLFTLLNIKLKFPRYLAAIICVLIFASFILGILAFISYEVTDMATDFDTIKKMQIHL